MPKLTIEVSQQEADEFARTGELVIKKEKELVIKKEKEKEWPKNGDEYWYLTPAGLICSDLWCGLLLDEGCKEMNNCFRTKEEAIAYRDYLKAVATVTRAIRERNGGWKADWSGGVGSPFLIIYDHARGTFFVDFRFNHEYVQCIPYCKSKEVAESIIKDYKPELRCILSFNS